MTIETFSNLETKQVAAVITTDKFEVIGLEMTKAQTIELIEKLQESLESISN